MKMIKKKVLSVLTLFMTLALAVTFVFPQTALANDTDDFWEMYLDNPKPVKIGTVYKAKFSDTKSDEKKHFTFESAGGTYTITVYCRTIMNPLEEAGFDHYQLPVLFEGLVTNDGKHVVSEDASESSGPVMYSQGEENGWYKSTDTVGTFKAGTLVAVELQNNRIEKNYGIKGDKPFTGEYKVVINGKAPKAQFKPGKAAIKGLSGGKKYFVVKWGKVKNAAGYQIKLGLNKSQTKKPKTITIRNDSQVKAKIKTQYSRKRYYVKVRAYRVIHGKKYYGAWSAVKAVRTK